MKAGGVTGEIDGVLEVWPVELVHRPQTAEVERADVQVDVVVFDVELSLEQLAHLVARVRVELQSHGAAEPAPAQLELDRREEVVGLLLLEREVGVAGDAEAVVVDRPPCRGRADRGGRR